jgi:hypothetical protein
MTYFPINVAAYTAAFSGAVAGMGVSGWITDQTSSDYEDVTLIAGAFAQAFDQVWNNATQLNNLEQAAITAAVQTDFNGRGPGPFNNPTFQDPSNWTKAAGACAALVLESDIFFTNEGINPGIPGTNTTASGIQTTTTVVNVSSAIAPTPGQILTAISSTKADWQTPNVIYVGPPIDGIQDDWAAINTAVQVAPYGSIVRLTYSNTPYICNHTRIELKSAVTLALNHNTIKTTTAFGLATCPVGCGTGPTTTIMHLNSPAPADSMTLDVVWVNTDRIVPGQYFWISMSNAGHTGFRALTVVDYTISPGVIGATITLYAPTSFALIAGEVGYVRANVVKDPTLLLEGATILATFDGPFADNRWVEFIDTVRPVVLGPGILQQVGGQVSTAMIGFDNGCFESTAKNYVVIGLDGTNGNGSGTAVEGQANAVIENLTTYNLGYPLWNSRLYDSEVSNITAYNCTGFLYATGSTILPATEFGCHRNTYRGMRAINVIGTLGVLWTTSDFCNNEFTDVHMVGSTPNFQTAMVVGASGTKACSGNHFDLVDCKDIQIAWVYGGGLPDKYNTIDVLTLDGVQSFFSGGFVPQSLTIGSILGTISTIGKLSIPNSANLNIGNVDVFTTQLFGATPVEFSSHGQITLNGTTTVFYAAPWVGASTNVSLTRQASGGTSHNPPSYTLVNNTTAITGTANTTGGIASYVAGTGTEDLNNSGHYLQWFLNGFIPGPCVLNAKVKPLGRNWIAIVLGPNLVYINLITGAVGTMNGSSRTWTRVNSDGTVDIEILFYNVTNSDCYAYFAIADNTLVYTGTGAAINIIYWQVIGLNAVALTAEVNNADVYAVTVT